TFHVPDRRQEPLVAARPLKRSVELADGELKLHNRRHGRLAQALKPACQMNDPRLRSGELELKARVGSPGGPFGPVAFEIRPPGIRVLCVPPAGDTNHRPPVWHKDHEVARLQIPQRLAHRRAAYPEPLAELILQKMSARRVDALEDGLLKPQDDLVGEA